MTFALGSVVVVESLDLISNDLSHTSYALFMNGTGLGMVTYRNKMDIKMILVHLATLLALICPSFGALDNRGTRFIVGFMDNKITSHIKPELFITTSLNKNITVQITAPKAPTLHLNKTFMVHNGQVQRVEVDEGFRHVDTEMSSKGILITADDEIVVYGVNREGYSDDGYLGLPVDVLGTEYYTASYAPAYYQTVFLVLGTEPSTHVSIHLANNPKVNVTYKNNQYHGNDWINVTLNQFDSFQLAAVGDLTGSYVRSDKPVSVLSGNKKAVVGINVGSSRDHLVEHLLPVRSWGKEFATVPIPQRTTGDIFRFIASEDNTTVNVTGQINGKAFNDHFVIPKAGGFVQKEYSSSLYSYVKSDKPLQLMQYSETEKVGAEPGDPSMITVPPIEQYAADYTFTTPKYSKGTYTNYFMFIINATEKAGLRLDNKPLPSSTKYNNIPGTQLVAGFVTITTGTHVVEHVSPTTVIGGILFGKAHLESYGFPVGLLFKPLNSGCVISTMVYGDEIDNDCDGEIDEELCVPVGSDGDGDGRIDEDCSAQISPGLIG